MRKTVVVSMEGEVRQESRRDALPFVQNSASSDWICRTTRELSGGEINIRVFVFYEARTLTFTKQSCAVFDAVLSSVDIQRDANVLVWGTSFGRQVLSA